MTTKTRTLNAVYASTGCVPPGRPVQLAGSRSGDLHVIGDALSPRTAEEADFILEGNIELTIDGEPFSPEAGVSGAPFTGPVTGPVIA